MERKINSKTTKAELIEMVNHLANENDILKKNVDELYDELEKRKDVVYNLNLYLAYVKRSAKELWGKMLERFSGMPGFAPTKKAAAEAKKKAEEEKE